MPKITQEISKNGKAAFTKKVNSPTDKGRGVMPPPSKAHKKGKGKGSYDRKNPFENEENLSDRISKELEKYPDGEEVTIDSLKKEFNKRGGVPKMDKKSYDKLIKKRGMEEEEKACWDGYKKQGTKKKGGKNVNNCVEESTNLHKFIEAIMTSNHAEAHKQLKDAINSKIQERIAQEIEKPLF
jgi:hypothetical protein